MPLFIFRRVRNPERVYWGSESEETAKETPLAYAFHPTREDVTEEEWGVIVEKAGKRYKVEWARFMELSDQVGETLQREGVKISDPQFLPRSEKRLRELGAIPFGMQKSLGEVLSEEDFIILNPKELTYQVPLTDWEKKRITDMKQSEKEIEEIASGRSSAT